MIKTAAQILAEVGLEEEEEVNPRLNSGRRRLMWPPQPGTTEIMLELIARRKALGLSQRAVAEKMNDISQSMISEWERGRSQPTLHNLILYAKALEGHVRLVWR